jgi:Glycosyl hydrolase family 59/Ricin-type beta-trefoil lectin domain
VRTRRLWLVLLTVIITSIGLTAQSWAAPAVTTSITVDGTQGGRTFDGIGAISGGGGNSRLLANYPAAQQSQILDYLFKPGVGADLQILKVEIGGDTNSTDGAEPSVEHAAGVVNCNVGYEFWLMEQAKARNPNIRFYGLSWGAPGWVGSTFWTTNTINYLVSWLNCAKADGLTISYLGGWNERGHDIPWYEQLRSTLNTSGYSAVQIVADDSFGWAAATDAASTPAFNSAVSIFGSHYPCGYLSASTTCTGSSTASGLGKPLWASENGSLDQNSGAPALIRSITRGYLDASMTAYINWPLIAAIYPTLPFNTVGLMSASQPWSGAYTVGESLWATAQVTQFTAPGWTFINSASGYLGGNRANGSYVSLKSPNAKDYSTILETTTATAAQTVNLTIAGGLSTGTVHVWSTNLNSPSSSFVHSQDINPTNGSYSLTLQPGFIYSVTTTTGQGKGTATSPAPGPLALPYSDNYDADATGSEAAYLSDMQGAFQVQPCAARTGQCVQQMAPVKPVEWQDDSDAFTLAGDTTWANYTVKSDVNLAQPGTVELFGRANTQSRPQSHQNAYLFRVSNTGAWSIVRSSTSGTNTTLASGTRTALGTNTWHTLSMTLQGTSISAAIDGVTAGSATDSAYQTGQIGLGVVGYQTDQFDNLTVTPGTGGGTTTGPITSGLPGKCVDNFNNTTTNGNKIDLWDCNSGASQQWTLANGALQNNGKCMDVTGQATTDGTLIELWDCNGGTNQQWTSSNGELISAQSGKCLDDPASTTTNGTQLEIWTCNGGANQHWTLPN